jgi:hypothetical protein
LQVLDFFCPSRPDPRELGRQNYTNTAHGIVQQSSAVSSRPLYVPSTDRCDGTTSEFCTAL